MVVKIRHVENFQTALAYNEDKVAQGRALFLDAGHFLKDSSTLSKEDKLSRFMMRFDQNISVKRNCIHMTLNFSPEDDLNPVKLKSIAASYLKLIGLEYEPYLLYEHNDAAHPHVHVITTPIRSNGEKVQLFNVGSQLLNPAREQIEEEFNLVRTGYGQTKRENRPVRVVNYGADPIRESINSVLGRVLGTYRYTSLAELNAVLSAYNIAAFLQTRRRFKEGKRALWYFVTNKNGQALSAPVKSSVFSVKATWSYISGRFADNNKLRQTGQARIKNAVYFALGDNRVSAQDFVETLKAQGIDASFKMSADGGPPSLFYVDHINGNVFDAASLGDQYDSPAVLSRLGCLPMQNAGISAADSHEHSTSGQGLSKEKKQLSSMSEGSPDQKIIQTSILSDLFKPYTDYNSGFSFKRKRKKRRRKIS